MGNKQDFEQILHFFETFEVRVRVKNPLFIYTVSLAFLSVFVLNSNIAPTLVFSVFV